MQLPPHAYDESDSGRGLGAVAARDQTEKQAAYRVLARKYRPARFEDLIGQDAMVRTLSNAFDLERIHQAYILTGVRGVGKTTTARILARAFNYELPARAGCPAVTRPAIRMPELGVHCQAIIESRHVDVIEMDAASHTGIDDVREIIESVRYLPVLARTKVYIIDEVHMLSKPAFNGLLKTLEEPPDHVKFVFATTEIEKVPVTVRSRCQRFDLRRVNAGVLTGYLASICAKEAVAIEDEALSLIARAAEGSVRDALSLLDQAIAHGAGLPGAIAADALRAMLGLADRGRIIDLFEALIRGHMAEALSTLKELHDFGADPSEVLAELAEFVHLITRLKLVPDAGQDVSLTPDERIRGQQFSQELSIPVLTRAWQLLLKGLREVKDSPRPLVAADMVLVRVGFAADLPTPDEALRKLAVMTSGLAEEGSPRSRRRRRGRRAARRCNRQPHGCAHAAVRSGRAVDRPCSVRGRGGSCRPPPRHSNEARARTRRAPRSFRARPHRVFARPRRLAAACANSRAPLAGMDGEPLDGCYFERARRPEPQGAGGRQRKRGFVRRARRAAGPKRARRVSGRRDCRDPRLRARAANHAIFRDGRRDER